MHIQYPLSTALLYSHIETSSLLAWKLNCIAEVKLRVPFRPEFFTSFFHNIMENYNILKKKSPFISNFATLTDMKIALWHNLLSTQNKANWLVPMLSKELWLVQRITQLSNLNQASLVMEETIKFNDNVIYASVLQQIVSGNQSECVHNWAYYYNVI